jgi:hypothetical protein
VHSRAAPGAARSRYVFNTQTGERAGLRGENCRKVFASVQCLKASKPDAGLPAVARRAKAGLWSSKNLGKHYHGAVTADTFKHEIAEAIKAYDKFVVCIDKVPEDCEGSLRSLMEKAIKAYENRGPHLRHGIALDRQITIILSQTDNERPLCGIYFNLHSPYQKRTSGKVTKAAD